MLKQSVLHKTKGEFTCELYIPAQNEDVFPPVRVMRFNVNVLYAACLGRTGHIQQGETAQRGLRRGPKGV